MTRLEKIESEVKALSPDEARKFAEWYDDWRADAWDEQIERDAKAGNLDKLAEQALADHKAGRTTPL